MALIVFYVLYFYFFILRMHNMDFSSENKHYLINISLIFVCYSTFWDYGWMDGTYPINYLLLILLCLQLQSCIQYSTKTNAI